MNATQGAIVAGAHEQSGLWDIVSELAGMHRISRREAFGLLQGQLEFIRKRSDVFLVKSTDLYEANGCELLPIGELLTLSIADVEFKEGGPFYYLSNVPGI